MSATLTVVPQAQAPFLHLVVPFGLGGALGQVRTLWPDRPQIGRSSTP